MTTIPSLIKAIKSPLVFIARTKRIETLRGLKVTINRLVDKAIAVVPDEVQKNLFFQIRNCFADFDMRDEAGKLTTVEVALTLLNQIEAEIKPIDKENLSQEIEERIKILSTPIQYIKGVGPHIAARLQKKGINTIEDALYFLPRDYEDRRNLKTISAARVGEKETLKGKILGLNLVSYHRRKVLEMVLGDQTGIIVLKWFNFNEGYINYLKKKFKLGQKVIVSGKVEAYSFRKEISHPDIELIDEEEKEDSLNFNRIVPKYSETEGLHQKTIRRIMQNVIENYAHFVPDGIPRTISQKQKLMDLSLSFKRVHFPTNDDDFSLLTAGISPYHRRIIFDEFFFLELMLALKKRGTILEKGISFSVRGNFLEEFEALLPFPLTGAQKRVIEEIKIDMAKPYPMHRLIQGDVGSGKTIVAFAAALIAIENNYQAAIMAPTEILAEQHFFTLRQLAIKKGINVAYLFSRMKKSLRNEVYKNIKSGKIDLIVGTHAIIQEGVEFARLGLGIIDEQHRFGVIQRATLKKKGESPDILVMTATPIPRTLAMTVYGDLDISIIDEMPPGRKPVKTKVIHERERPKVYEYIAQEIEKGNQAYIVYPLIEESEKMDLMNATKMYHHLQKEVFPQYRLALLHGKMKSEEKEAVMEKFKRGEIQILVATTVVEVGIDVPRATLMVIEHAERFGLSQLHQLRGRVGRGEYPSLCILLAQYKKSDEAQKRLKIMEETNDGFKIAEEDLKIRGPGEFFGVRQSGIPDFRVANIIRDARILNEARKEAFELVRNDPFLEKPENYFLKKVLKYRWKGRLELVGVG